MFQINVNNGNKSIILTVSIMLSTSSILYKVKINKLKIRFSNSN